MKRTVAWTVVYAGSIAILAAGCNVEQGEYDPQEEEISVIPITQALNSSITPPSCPAFDPSSPDTAFCNDPLCPCKFGEGDCDVDSHCGNDLVCSHNVGTHFGLPAHWDVCADCKPYNRNNPDGSFCKPWCPCKYGQGDCDADDQCVGSMVCGNNNGPDFGLPAGWEACINNLSLCGNGRHDDGEACDDGNRGDDNNGCNSDCQEKRGWYCNSWNECCQPDLPPPCYPRHCPGWTPGPDNCVSWQID